MKPLDPPFPSPGSDPEPGLLDPRDRELLEDLLDGRLGAEREAELRARLESEPVLRSAWAELVRLGDWLREEYAAEEARCAGQPPALDPRRLAERVLAEAVPVAVPLSLPVLRGGGRRNSSRARHRFRAACGAAAAAVVVGATLWLSRPLSVEGEAAPPRGSAQVEPEEREPGELEPRARGGSVEGALEAEELANEALIPKREERREKDPAGARSLVEPSSSDSATAAGPARETSPRPAAPGAAPSGDAAPAERFALGPVEPLEQEELVPESAPPPAAEASGAPPPSAGLRGNADGRGAARAETTPGEGSVRRAVADTGARPARRVSELGGGGVGGGEGRLLGGLEASALDALARDLVARLEAPRTKAGTPESEARDQELARSRAPVTPRSAVDAKRFGDAVEPPGEAGTASEALRLEGEPGLRAWSELLARWPARSPVPSAAPPTQRSLGFAGTEQVQAERQVQGRSDRGAPEQSPTLRAQETPAWDPREPLYFLRYSASTAQWEMANAALDAPLDRLLEPEPARGPGELPTASYFVGWIDVQAAPPVLASALVPQSELGARTASKAVVPPATVQLELVGAYRSALGDLETALRQAARPLAEPKGGSGSERMRAGASTPDSAPEREPDPAREPAGRFVRVLAVLEPKRGS